MFCIKCGKELKYEAKFCPRCGEQVVESVIDDIAVNGDKEHKNVKEAEYKKNKKPAILWIGIIGIIVLVAIVITTVVITCGSKKSEYDEKLDLGRKYLLDLDYEQAVLAFEEAIKIDPKKKDAYIELAEVYIKQGENEKAIATLENAKSKIENRDDEDILIRKEKEIRNKENGEVMISLEPTNVPTSLIQNPTLAQMETSSSTPSPTPSPSPSPSPVPVELLKPVIKVKTIDGGMQISVGNIEATDGYEIYIKGASDKKYFLVKTEVYNPEKNETTITGLKSELFYVKVRSYAEIDGEIIYSEYSNKKELDIHSSKEDFKGYFETLVKLYYGIPSGEITPDHIEHLLLDAYVHNDNNDNIDFMFKIETGNALPPDDILGLRGINDDGTASYIRCKYKDMIYFIENILGQKIKVKEGYSYNESFVYRDGYLTEWGMNYFMDYEAPYWCEPSDFTYEYDGDMIIASCILYGYLDGELYNINYCKTYWKPNSKSSIGYTLIRSE